MKVSIIASVALAAMAAAAPTAQNDKTRRVQGINLTGMTEKELKAVVAKVKKDPEVQEILERLNGTTNEDKMAVMDVGKKGLAYNDANALPPFIGRASWAYNWGAALNAPNFEGVPMCWGGGGDCDANGVFQKLDQGNTPFVLGYNEPDFPIEYGGSHMSPQTAYDFWGNDMFRFQDRGAQLVCPGISSYDTENSQFTGIASGFTWLRQWANWRNNPDEFRCVAQPLHWYGVNGMSGADQAFLFIDYMNNAHNVVNDIFRRDMPLWVTEFAPEPLYNPDVLADFVGIAASWLNQQPWVQRYAPFMAETMVSGGGLNRAGENFVNA